MKNTTNFYSRHSNFGALFSLKSWGDIIGLISTPNDKWALGDVLENKNIKNKILKPKTRTFMP